MLLGNYNGLDTTGLGWASTANYIHKSGPKPASACLQMLEACQM